MSPQFKEQARQAFRAIELLDPDGRDFHSHRAHQLVNNLVDKTKTQIDKDVYDLLFTWLAELELGRTAARPCGDSGCKLKLSARRRQCSISAG